MLGVLKIRMSFGLVMELWCGCSVSSLSHSPGLKVCVWGEGGTAFDFCFLVDLDEEIQ